MTIINHTHVNIKKCAATNDLSFQRKYFPLLFTSYFSLLLLLFASFVQKRKKCHEILTIINFGKNVHTQNVKRKSRSCFVTIFFSLYWWNLKRIQCINKQKKKKTKKITNNKLTTKIRSYSTQQFIQFTATECVDDLT